ncbi:MAG: UDP-N-acetylglucosamine--N-acetylmuramyl-(pentapeptide) pyrophosphoryl-undecaprenol N-acetylglucosamine transferase, partial [Acidimicrobiales bacterium]|nr:UDP-N-acetylglucosamine--N-acetylmuramyl-(pentapeptide) pyrophosphoryl-undecaprenol N-acetylglucosamine transferase [Acidimicrobiales bacterium]
RDFADVQQANPLTDADPLDYRLVEYEHDMASVYAASDLVVCRSGATSVAELATTGTPSILVPLPGAPGDHQTANAQALVECGGAQLIADAELDGARFVEAVDALLVQPARLEAMAAGAMSIARPDAASAVADLVVAHAAEAS